MSNPGKFVGKNHLIINCHECLQLHLCDYQFLEFNLNQKVLIKTANNHAEMISLKLNN